MEQIHLQSSTWFYDPNKPLGTAGGFGQVFLGTSKSGDQVAIKKIKTGCEDSGNRELRISNELTGRTLTHVLQPLDSGIDANSGNYFLAMPLADHSLQQMLDNGHVFPVADALDVLQQIAEGLEELKGLVHRDIKPANILYQDKTWKIADFGIAKFVEESTSLLTLKDCLSPDYAAPEQWRLESSTSATDVYALGCIAFRLLAGKRAFPGPTSIDFREQHLHQAVPELSASIPAFLRTLVGMLLRKSPDSRPNITRVKEFLGKAAEQSDSLPSPVVAAAARIEAQQSRAESIAAVAASEEARRAELARSGRTILAAILNRLRTQILNDAPPCDQQGESLSLGEALFPLPTPKMIPFPIERLPHSKYEIILATNISVQQITPRYTWSSSLLYCKQPGRTGYRWLEVSFMRISGNDNEMQPMSLLDKIDGARSRYEHVDLALSNVMHAYQAAFGPIPIDDEDEEEFIARWMSIFAAAAEGRLRSPMRLPMDAKFWTHMQMYGI